MQNTTMEQGFELWRALTEQASALQSRAWALSDAMWHVRTARTSNIESHEKALVKVATLVTAEQTIADSTLTASDLERLGGAVIAWVALGAGKPEDMETLNRVRATLDLMAPEIIDGVVNEPPVDLAAPFGPAPERGSMTVGDFLKQKALRQ